ncbi:PREDICTED: uncharacterized protein LOC108570800 [Habropoda laboriosa]|uniref:uncharacterized protein LOC108570800 n=1 Tax=Habropoda laboriosa TaxID=597456 RepID=UPI00083DCA56|nr:PREDICTED: uncharacterized protein LOC108570800 [Habropoda laboriosa]
MKYSAFCIILLAISEPLLVHAKKVILVIPQQTRRMGPPWRSVGPQRYRKSSQEVQYQRYHGPPGHYHQKKPVYVNPPFPHGGDDFDQGHERVNHVRIPHGKGVSHAVTYGKGYVPYDQIKGTFSLGRERHQSQQEQKPQQSEPEYSSSSFTSSDADYSPSGHSYESTQPEMFFPDAESALNYNERRNDRQKFYTSRSIDKDSVANAAMDFSGATDKDQLLLLQQRAAELYKNVISPPQGAVIVPVGVPTATIGGSKEGIVLRDTVALGEYQQKLQEMTKSWPQFQPNAVAALSNGYQTQQVTTGYSTGGSPASGYTGSISWPLNFAQPKQGYDVKEDTMEPPHDFRTMPIQTSPYHTFQVPINIAIPQNVHGRVDKERNKVIILIKLRVGDSYWQISLVAKIAERLTENREVEKRSIQSDKEFAGVHIRTIEHPLEIKMATHDVQQREFFYSSER